MSVNFSWTCPYCNHYATITENNFSSSTHNFDKGNKLGDVAIFTRVITCPNPECKEYVIDAFLKKASWQSGGYTYAKEDLLQWKLKPNSISKQFPDYIPKAIVYDYEEACTICFLSPKASATLSRRCLQGIIRDYWKESKGRLVDEIAAIKDKIDPTTWDAIDAVRKIGNIGAHMEKNINEIIDVDPQEAMLLIGLIEMLIKEWYIASHDRKKSLDAIIKLGSEK